MILEAFHPATRTWFEGAFAAPTAVQREGWGPIASGEDVLLLAPTGSGKTLAAFLWAIDQLGREGPSEGTRVVYISPLKALVYDVERNLRAPLVGIAQAARAAGQEFREPSVSMRTGDTPQKARRQYRKDPSDILVTTPESLYLLLSSGAREALCDVKAVIVDEVHALAPTKRGAHMALTLERLAAQCKVPPQRIGLSATVNPVEEVANFLAGGRPVRRVDTSAPPDLDLQICVPVRNLDKPQAPIERDHREPRSGNLMGGAQMDMGQDGMGYGAFQQPTPPKGIWAAMVPRLLEEILAHRSTIIFVNSRSVCERLARRFNELAGVEEDSLVRAHHGSVSHSQRREIEEALKGGLLRGIVATSSLELGIDMGAVDLVLQIESPRSTARGLQRAGRAGHSVGQRSRARIYPKFRGDLLESAVVARRMLAGALEPIKVPRNPLDVLAQHIVSMCAMDGWQLDDLDALIRSTWNFKDLSRAALIAVLDMLSGRYPSTDFADLRPRLDWDRDKDLLSARRGVKQLVVQNVGTIPDRGLYSVHLGPGGPRLGELDEEMVHESRAGETFVLGASTWRIEEITRDRVIVSPAPGEPGRMPFWHGEGPGRPIALGRAQGELMREIGHRSEKEATRWLEANSPLDERAVQNLVEYLAEQKEVTGTLPTDQAITIERFRDELGDWRVCILTPFGARVHAPWAIALEATLSEASGFGVQTMWSDDGIVVRLADMGEDEPLPDLDALVPDPDTVEDLVTEHLLHSPLFASLFRENAGRALLLPRNRVGKRMPLWAQRLKAQNLLAVAREYPAFPIVLETYRSCLADHFDLPALVELLRSVRRREVRVDAVETQKASPFARSLVYRYVAEYMYEGDTPVAERRAQALTLDRDLLRDLLGQEQLRQLLDAEVMAALEVELQCLVEHRLARHADGLVDLLRRVGDLSTDEAAERSEGDAAAWLASVRGQKVAEVRVAGEPRWIAAEDCGRYRDALGVVPPAGIPTAFLEKVPGAMGELCRRYARTHCPFTVEEVAARFGADVELVQKVLDVQVAEERLLQGAFRPKGRGTEYCDPEVLRVLRQRTLAKLRGEVAPVEAPVLARFLSGWHGLDSSRRGGERLLEALQQLEGLALPFGELEGRILPARVPGFHPRMLDELGASGALVWVGAGPLGARDGKVRLYRRANLALLHTPQDPPPLSPVHEAILEHLGTAGASFMVDLSMAVDAPQSELRACLFDLVWAGLITNDTLRALRALANSQRAPVPGRRPGRRAWRGAATAAGGRWSRVDRLMFGRSGASGAGGLGPSPTERAHALALTLLERYGVLSREAAKAEDLPGGFSAVYKVLRAMEQAGKVRRGWFVDGLVGAQFAMPGAVDRLRAARREGDAPEAVVLPTVDPANPYGALLEWPATQGTAPRRAAGASVVLVEGAPVLFVASSGKRVSSFAAAKDPRVLSAALKALAPIARLQKGAALRVERIDGDTARGSELTEAFLRAGFTADHRGLTLEARP